MFADFLAQSLKTPLAEDAEHLVGLAKNAEKSGGKNVEKWRAALSTLRQYPRGKLRGGDDYLIIDCALEKSRMPGLEKTLRAFLPWRKGPYQIGNLKIESEWQGAMKWRRVLPHIVPLRNKMVLDVGAGNGFFTFQMGLSGAQFALGVEPFLLFNYQFRAIKGLTKNTENVFVLPLALEDLTLPPIFDTIFSMGVIYHRKSPLAHLQKLKTLLKPGGALVVETLVVPGGAGESLTPENRYGKMRNVWFIPTVETMILWLKRCGFVEIFCADRTRTETSEQRKTDWIGENAKSLADFLNPENPNQTIEGYPAPVRAIFVCRKNKNG